MVDFDAAVLGRYPRINPGRSCGRFLLHHPNWKNQSPDHLTRAIRRASTDYVNGLLIGLVRICAGGEEQSSFRDCPAFVATPCAPRQLSDLNAVFSEKAKTILPVTLT
jgi:hypothetical protein